MSPLLTSSSFVFATAMVFSTTAVFLAFLRPNNPFSPNSHPPNNLFSPNSHPPILLRPCLSSGGHKDRKKKKVQFAKNVKNHENERIVEEFRKKTQGKLKTRCGNEIPGIQVRGMPANRVALYNGILRDRSQRMGFSY